MNRESAVSYLNSVDRIYVIDAFVNWDPAQRTKVRVVTTRAYHALFMHNMLIRPTKEELENFGEPDFVIYNAGACRLRVPCCGYVHALVWMISKTGLRRCKSCGCSSTLHGTMSTGMVAYIALRKDGSS